MCLFRDLIMLMDSVFAEPRHLCVNIWRTVKFYVTMLLWNWQRGDRSTRSPCEVLFNLSYCVVVVVFFSIIKHKKIKMSSVACVERLEANFVPFCTSHDGQARAHCSEMWLSIKFPDDIIAACTWTTSRWGHQKTGVVNQTGTKAENRIHLSCAARGLQTHRGAQS